MTATAVWLAKSSGVRRMRRAAIRGLRRSRSAELPRLSIDVSVLGPLESIDPSDPLSIVVGRHGLVVEQGRRRGLLLPQVATEWHWTPEQFLRQTCVKAGLPPDAWRAGTRGLPVRGGRVRRSRLVTPLLGAHLSIAGGLPRAVDRARATSARRCRSSPSRPGSGVRARCRPRKSRGSASGVEATGIHRSSPTTAT